MWLRAAHNGHLLDLGGSAAGDNGLSSVRPLPISRHHGWKGRRLDIHHGMRA